MRGWEHALKWYLELEKYHKPEKVKELIYAELGIDYPISEAPIGDITRLNLLREEGNLVDNICEGGLVDTDKIPAMLKPYETIVKIKKKVKNCKHTETCPRECRLVEPYDERWCPVWLQPADGHNSEGWVPCDMYINIEDTKKFHCAHVILNRRGNYLMDGYEFHCCLTNIGQLIRSCKGYSNCDRYTKGNEI